MLGEPREGFAAVGDSGVPGGSGGAEADGVSEGGVAACGFGSGASGESPSGGVAAGSPGGESSGGVEVSAVGGGAEFGRPGVSGRRMRSKPRRVQVGGAGTRRAGQVESLDLNFAAGQCDPPSESVPEIDAVIATTGFGEEIPLPEEPPVEDERV